MIAAALGIAAFGHSIKGGFVWDDHEHLLRNPTIRDISKVGRLLSPRRYATASYRYGYRPLAYSSFATEWAAWGKRPAAFHGTNVVLYVTNLCLVFAVFRRVCRSRFAALVGMAAFALMPYHADSVAYVHSRDELLVCLFVLLGALAFPARGPGPAIGRCALSVVCFALALSAKEHAVVFPMLLLAYAVALPGQIDIRRLAVRLAAVWASALLLVAVRAALAGGGIGPDGAASPEWPARAADVARVADAGRSLMYYARVLTFPVRFSLEPGLHDWGAVGMSALWAVGAVAILLCFIFSGSRRMLAFGLAWTGLALLPFINLIPIPMRPLANQRLLLPSVGVAACAAAVTGRLNRASRTVLMGIVLALWAASAVRYTFVWRSDDALHSEAARASPQAARPRFHLGLAYFDAGELHRARRAFERSLARSPGYDQALNGLGLIDLLEGDTASAYRSFTLALKANPSNTKARVNLAAMAIQRGDLKDARSYAERALRLAPDSAEAHFNLGRIEETEGREERALTAYGRAIECRPDFARPHYALALAFSRKGRYDLATRYYRRAAELDESLFQARTNLAEIHRRAGRITDARRETVLAVESAPYEWRPRCLLGILAEDAGDLERAARHYRLAIVLAPSESVPRQRLESVLARKPR